MRTLFTFSIILSVMGLFAQSDTERNLTIQGKIIDEQQQAIPYANVVLMASSNKELVKADYSQENGTFSLTSLQAGSYILEVTNIGYQTHLDSIQLEDGSLLLENIILIIKAEELQAVRVKAQKAIVQVQADKTVFNVNESLSASGTNGFELLRKAPGVIVDNNDNLIVEGKSGIRIYINGRPSLLGGEDLKAYLQSLQSSEIEAIEIITQPSSKFEAEGNAGIINILLKREKGLGTNGSLSTSLNINEYLLFNGSASINHRTKRSNFFANYSNSLGENYNFFNMERTQNGILIDSRTSSVNDILTHSVRTGYDHFISDKHTIGVILSANLNNRFTLSDSRTLISKKGNSIDSILIADNDIDRRSHNLSANLNYRMDQQNGQVFNIDLDYAYFSNETDFYQPNFYYDPEETEILSQNIGSQMAPTGIHITSFKADFEQPFWKGVLSLGTKLSLVNTQNDFFSYNHFDGQKLLDSTQSNEFTYFENVNALYVNYNRSFGEKWNVQAGLRMENTHSIGKLISIQDLTDEVVDRNYTNLFGSGGLTYQMNANNALALQYSRRIQRPNYEDLNPFEYKLNELSLRKGNPFLQPQYTDNIKLAHTFKHRFTTSLSYTFVRDFFAQVTEQSGEKGGFINTRNVANQEIYNLGMSYPFTFYNWWSLYSSVNAFYASFEATHEDFVPIDQATLNIYLQNSFSLPWDVKMEVSGWFNTPSIWGGTFRTEALGSLNFAFQRKFLSKSMTARIAFNDVLFTSPWYATTSFGNVHINGNGGWNSRNVALSLSYNFGDKEVKGTRKRETGLESEKDRVGG